MANALIGLREGLEAGMVVMVLIAFLVGQGRKRDIRIVWTGVSAALVASVAAGFVLGITASSLSDRGQELFGATASAFAVVLITTMIFWMRHSEQQERLQLEGQMSRALRLGPFAVFIVALVAVLREGLEAAVFVLVLSDGPGASAAQSVTGLLAGVIAAIVLTWLMYAGLIRVNMARFLTVTGFVLIVIAAGLLAHGVTDLQHAGVLPGATVFAFDASAVLPPDSWIGHFIGGLFGMTAQPTVLALIAWVGYLVIMVTLFLVASRTPSVLGQRQAAVAPQATEAVESRGTNSGASKM